MKVTNLTKNTVIAQDLTVADSLFSRMKGLLGRKTLGKSQALLLKPCNSIHTFFMKFPIDVIFVGKNNVIVKVLSSVPPFRLSRVYFAASFAIELPAGTAMATSTKEGDIITL